MASFDILEDDSATVVAMFPRDRDESPSVFARLDTRGVPSRVEPMSVSSGVLARFGGALHVISDRGTQRIVERDADSSDPAFQDAGYREFDFGFSVSGASSLEDGVVLVGRTSDGFLVTRWFDGFDAPPLPGGDEVGGGVSAVATVPLSGTEAAVVVRTAGAVRFGVARASGVTWRDPVPVDGDSGGVAVAVHRGVAAAFAVESDSLGDELVTVWGGIARGDETAQPICSVAGGFALLGAMDGLDGAVAIAEERDRLATFDSGGRCEPPAALVAWTANRSRFYGPMAFHMILFVVIGMLGRSARLSRSRAAPKEIAVRLAPLFRRILAFAIDLGIACGIGSALFFYTMGPAELSYIQTVAATGVRDTVDPLLVSSQMDFLLLCVWVLTTVASLSEAAFGRSFGKSVARLRVIAVDATPLTLPAAATRSLFLMVDVYLPIGLAFVLFTKRRQRLGDVIAGTMVIDARAPVIVAPAAQPSER